MTHTKRQQTIFLALFIISSFAFLACPDTTEEGSENGSEAGSETTAENVGNEESENEDEECRIPRGALMITGAASGDFADDVDEMTQLFAEPASTGGLGIKETHIKEIVGEEADDDTTMQDIEDDWEYGLEEVQYPNGELEPVCYEEFFIYYSGHGSDMGRFSLGEDDGDTEISHAWFVRNIVSKICAKKIYIIVDSCYAGHIIRSLRMNDRCQEIVVLAASDQETPAKSMDGGLFSKSLRVYLRALNLAFTDAQVPMKDKLKNAFDYMQNDSYEYSAWFGLQKWDKNVISDQNPEYKVLPKNTDEGCCQCCDDDASGIAQTEDGGTSVDESETTEDTDPVTDDETPEDADPVTDDETPEDTDPVTDDETPEDTDPVTDDETPEDTDPITDDETPEDTDPVTDDETPEDTDPITDDETPEDTDPITDDETPEDTDPTGEEDTEPETPEPVPGCTDKFAVNHNPDATVDDGSCQYAPVSGDSCTTVTHYDGWSKITICVAFHHVPDGTIVVFEMGWARQEVKVENGRACAVFDIEGYGTFSGTATAETEYGKTVHEWEVTVDEKEQSCDMFD